MAPLPDERASRWRRRIIGALLATLVAVVTLLPYGAGFVSLYSLTRAGCQRTNTPDAYNLDYETVVFLSGSLEVRAFYIPGETDAIVILAPPFRGDAGWQLPYAAMFHEAGLGVLSLPSRSCLGSRQSLGYTEGDDVAAAYTYLATRADVNPDRIGVHGFSAAGAASLFGAAREPRIRAVSIMGNYDDFYETFGTPQPTDNLVERAYKWGASAGFRAGSGVPVRALQPTAVIEQIVPRPILFVYGSEEPSLAGGRQMYEKAGSAGTFWEVADVGHGGYLSAYPDDAREIIGGFHYRHLLEESD